MIIQSSPLTNERGFFNLLKEQHMTINNKMNAILSSYKNTSGNFKCDVKKATYYNKKLNLDVMAKSISILNTQTNVEKAQF